MSFNPRNRDLLVRHDPAQQAHVPVWNGLTDEARPTQVPPESRLHTIKVAFAAALA